MRTCLCFSDLRCVLCAISLAGNAPTMRGIPLAFAAPIPKGADGEYDFRPILPLAMMNADSSHPHPKAR